MNTISMVMLIIGTSLSIVYIIMLILGNKEFSAYIDGLTDNEHFFKPLYPVGFFILQKINYKYNSKLDRKRLKECEVIFGERYGEYYFRLNYAQKVSLCLFAVPFIFLLYPVADSPFVLVLGIICIICAYWYFDMQITDIMSKRMNEIERELPNVLSKLTLLVNAGMILSEAWVKISSTGKSTIYQEMNNAIMEIQNGTDEVTAYLHFADKCGSVEVKKFVSTLVQNITKGNKELVGYLKKQTDISWETKKHNIRRQGEKASSKLMIPIGIMFVGILILIVVPIFSNFSF